MNYSLFELWLAWMTAHLLGDFVFQSDQMVARKSDLNVLASHAVIHGLIAWVLTFRSGVTMGAIRNVRSACCCSASAFSAAIWPGARIAAAAVNSSSEIGIGLGGVTGAIAFMPVFSRNHPGGYVLTHAPTRWDICSSLSGIPV